MSYVFGYTNFIDGSAHGVVPPTNLFLSDEVKSPMIALGDFMKAFIGGGFRQRAVLHGVHRHADDVLGLEQRCDTFAPIGPYIVTADEIKDPHKLQIRSVVMQNFNTDDMAHKIPRFIEWITSIHTLHPGDILATGTDHRGLNPFMDGDNIDLSVRAAARCTSQCAMI